MKPFNLDVNTAVELNTVHQEAGKYVSISKLISLAIDGLCNSDMHDKNYQCIHEAMYGLDVIGLLYSSMCTICVKPELVPNVMAVYDKDKTVMTSLQFNLDPAEMAIYHTAVITGDNSMNSMKPVDLSTISIKNVNGSFMSGALLGMVRKMTEFVNNNNGYAALVYVDNYCHIEAYYNGTDNRTRRIALVLNEAHYTVSKVTSYGV